MSLNTRIDTDNVKRLEIVDKLIDVYNNEHTFIIVEPILEYTNTIYKITRQLSNLYLDVIVAGEVLITKKIALSNRFGLNALLLEIMKQNNISDVSSLIITVCEGSLGLIEYMINNEPISTVFPLLKINNEERLAILLECAEQMGGNIEISVKNALNGEVIKNPINDKFFKIYTTSNDSYTSSIMHNIKNSGGNLTIKFNKDEK